MENIIQVLLNENILSFCVIGRLAKTSKHLRLSLLKVKNKFTWIAKSHSLDLLRWKTNISDTHHILQTALKMNKCAQRGIYLLTWCCSPSYWGKGDIQPTKAFDLELMLKADRPLRRLYKGKSNCYHMYDDTKWGYNTDPQDSFQHVTGIIGSWTVRTRCGKTNWSGSNGWDDWLTTTQSLETCGCLHCKTYQTFPSRYCNCQVCSDPVKGPAYWKKLTNPE